MQKVKAKIHLGNIRRNAEKFRALTGKKICAVVKANAYGHGAIAVVNALESVVDCFAVALIEEGLEIRGVTCGKDILVFTPPMTEEECFVLASNGFIATVGDLRTAKLLSAVCKKYGTFIKVHVKVNTGMNRYGMNGSMLGKVCKFLQNDPFVSVEGIYTHLYDCSMETARKQERLFLQFQRIAKRYFSSIVAHLGGTYAAFLGNEAGGDMLRVGIGLYGYLPTSTPQRFKEMLCLEKGMSVYARVETERKVSFGGVGYGRPCLNKEIEAIQRLSVVRYGYADGFLRQRKNGAFGWERHLNNLCMDVCLTRKERKGQWLPVLLDADETAKVTGTISYEVLCAATRRAEFVYDTE
ncbi:MAG: alanine racemase [Clostridia bacterium]|nr:alanine racemase [Clostridia bacterium]